MHLLFVNVSCDLAWTKQTKYKKRLLFQSEMHTGTSADLSGLVPNSNTDNGLHWYYNGLHWYWQLELENLQIETPNRSPPMTISRYHTIQYAMRPCPGYPAEKFVIRGGGAASVSSILAWPFNRRWSASKSIRGICFASAWLTFFIIFYWRRKGEEEGMHR